MLRGESRFHVLLSGDLLSKIGDGIHEFVFIIVVLKVTENHAAQVGVIYFFRFIPYLVLGPIGGVLSDRWSRMRLMVGADLARMVVTGVFCALLLTEHVGPTALATIGMVMTALRTLFQPAFQASVPTLVSPENLPRANAGIQVTGEIGWLVGPALGGAALTFAANPGGVLMVDALTYAISTVCVLIACRMGGEVRANDAQGSLNLRALYSELKHHLAGLRFKPQLFVTIVYSAACILFVSGALRVLIPILVKSEGFSDSFVGYTLSAAALGAIVGGLICAAWRPKCNSARLMGYWIAYGLIIAAAPVFSAFWPGMLATCFVLGVAGALVDIAIPTNIQHLSSETNVGKNFSLFSTLANTGEALSGSLAGLVVMTISVATTISVIGVSVALIAYFGKRKLVTQDA